MQSTRGGWVDSQLRAFSRCINTQSCSADVQRPSVYVCVDDARRSLTLLHLAGRTCRSSTSIVLKDARAQPPSSWMQLAGRTETNLPFPERQLVPSFLLPARPSRGSGGLPPPGPLSVLTAVFSAHSVQMPLIGSPLSQRQHHSAVIHQPRRKRWPSANQVSRFTKVSQSPPRFNSKWRTTRLIVVAKYRAPCLLTNRVCTACRRCQRSLVSF